MTEETLRKKLKTFKNAFERLKEALSLDVEDSDIVIDATIQRFEFTFELAWKTIKKFAETLQAGKCNSERSCIKLAYRIGWIKDEEKWLSLLEARNLTSHTYNYATAVEVYNLIKSEHEVFQELILSLEKELYELEGERE